MVVPSGTMAAVLVLSAAAASVKVMVNVPIVAVPGASATEKPKLSLLSERSEERGVGQECRSRWLQDHLKESATLLSLSVPCVGAAVIVYTISLAGSPASALAES